MPLLLLPIALFLLYLLSRKMLAMTSSCADRRDAVLSSAVIMGSIAVAGSEVLSFCHAINGLGVALLWILVIAATLWSLKTVPLTSSCPANRSPKPFAVTEKALIIGSTALLVIVGITALIAPPNNWDSLTTHLARVAHWLQNGSLANYPTSMLRQLNYPACSSILILQVNALSGSDRFANLIQWLALVMSAVGAAVIAREFGASRRTQIIAAVFTLSIPMAILQGSSTQNDLVVSMWMIAFIVFGFRALRTGITLDTALCGAAFGLALYVKGIAYFTAVPFLIYFVFRSFLKNKSKALILAVSLVAGLLVLNGPYFSRSLSLTGTLIPPSETKNMSMQAFGPGILAANTLRNLSIHLSSPWPSWNMPVTRGVNALLSAMHIDAQDPRTNQTPFTLNTLPFHEDNANAPLHMLILFSCLFLLAVPRVRKDSAPLLPYALCMITGIFLFNLFVKWTPFNARYQLPFFIIAAPVAAIILNSLSRKTATALALTVLIASIPWLLLNTSRPWIGKASIFTTPRTNQYFANNPAFTLSYHKAIDLLNRSGCFNVGLSFGGDSWEYPLWAIAKDEGRPIRFEHVLVNNASGRSPYPRGSFSPCAVITDQGDKREVIVTNGVTFAKNHILPFLYIYTDDSTLSPQERTIRYFRKSISPPSPLPQETRPEDKAGLVLSSIRTRLEDGLKVDLSILASRDPETAKMFVGLYLRSLSMLLDRAKENDMKGYAEGQQVLGMWYSWVKKNQGRIQKIFLD